MAITPERLSCWQSKVTVEISMTRRIADMLVCFFNLHRLSVALKLTVLKHLEVELRQINGLIST